MATVAIILLALGLTLTTFGTGTYLQVACADGTFDADPETLRIARGIATIGRRTTGPALYLWFNAWHTANPPATALLLVATAAALASYSTRPGRLTSHGKPVA